MYHYKNRSSLKKEKISNYGRKMNMNTEERRYYVYYTCCVIVAAFSFRSLITTVGPVVGDIKSDLNISSGIAGMLTTIPVIIFSVTAFFAGAILPRYRVGISAPLCFIITTLGAVIRSYGGTVGLYGGTLLIGLGIGTLNVMVPALNREKMPKQIGVITGLYNVSLNLMAGMGSGLTFTLSRKLGGWRPAIAIWGIFPMIAIPLWIRLSRMDRFGDREGEAFSPFAATGKFLNKKVWAVAILMALQSFIYYSLVIAWCPTMLTDKGISSETTGLMTIFLQVISLIPAYFVPVNAVFPKRRTAIAMLGGCSYLLSTVIYLLGNSMGAMILCCILWGISAGSCFSYVLALISLSGKNKTETTWISGFVQMFGYAFAAIGPALFGFIVDANGSWTVPMIVVMMLSILYTLTGVFSGKLIGDGK